MDLVKAFRLTNKTKAAIVGSGGKTTTMFQLARDFGARVILTTTTHLAQDQLKLADQHITLEGLADLPSIEKELVGDVLLFTGPEVETNQVKGTDQEILVQLAALADRWECPLLIEADGTRQLPIKAQADHEPAIPEFVDTLIVVSGLSGLGKPLNEKWVHRPKIFSDLVGVPLGSEGTSKHLVTALTSPRWGMKNIPDPARKLLLINQLDCFPNWRIFHDHLPLLLSHYHAVGFAVLEDQLLLELHEPTAGVILAAGGSTRFGTTKQLLDWKGKPLVTHVAEIALAGGLSPVLVVTGADHIKVTRVLEDLPVECVHNPDWEQGQSSSVRTGIEALPWNVGAVIFLLVDQPFIPPELIRRMVKSHAVKRELIIHPQVNDERANPVLFDREVFQELSSLKGDTGGRVLFNTFPTRVIPWENDLIQKDIDTLEDFEILRSAGE